VPSIDPASTVDRSSAAGAAPGPASESAGRPSAAPLPEQFRLPLAYLRSLGEGTHRLTIRIDPESVGPVRIVADVGADQVKVALHAATDSGRTLLRDALPELRSELASQSPRAQLDLGGSGGGREQAGQREEAGQRDEPPAAHEPADHPVDLPQAATVAGERHERRERDDAGLDVTA
jgi:flagellar hook-length control protein FliK